ncbi:uncharacterized protein LOC141849526 isoform X2 [Brevipalpus obovatus]|uniref:uncharacterized protein LOC141849526 isoform X2 n=1 Tax=Brevipalpus obovatus TaxID=246614 RepID=UPI003D9ECC96
MIFTFLKVNIFLTILTVLQFSQSTVTGHRSGCNQTVDIYQPISAPNMSEYKANQPLTCVYTIRVQPELMDWSVSIRFTTFRVGEVSIERDRCERSYFQIIDGYKKMNGSGHTNPGYFCGEIDMPKTIVSETSFVRLIYHSDQYDKQTQFQISTDIQKQDERWNNLGQLYKIRSKRGQAIPGSYCDRIFQDCSPGHCYIHSPGYPEIYPRNLKCRYLIQSTGVGFIKMEVVDMDVDAEQCENLLVCFPRPVTTDPKQCLYDYIRVYDGPSESDPLIATMCGRGRLSSNIIASKSWMLIEFITSPAGHLTDTGFQLKIETNIVNERGKSIEISDSGLCIIRETITESSELYGPPRSWYEANLTCSYLFTAPGIDDRLSLEFEHFRVRKLTLCEEDIRLYDSPKSDPFKLMNILCDTNKPLGGASDAVYTTSGPSLLVQFNSRRGSLDGSSLDYLFHVKRIVPERKVDSHVVSQNCSHSVSSSDRLRGSFTIDPTQFDFPIRGQIHCNLSFDASPLVHGRVNLTIVSSFNPSLSCGKYCDIGIFGANQAKLLIHRSIDADHFIGPLCYCEPIVSDFPFSFTSPIRTSQRINLLSNSSILRASINLPSDWAQRPDSKPIQVFYQFVRETRCGPDEILTYPQQLQGRLNFPINHEILSPPEPPILATFNGRNFELNQNTSFTTSQPEAVSSDWPLICKWRIFVTSEMDIAFNIQNLKLADDCSNNFLLIKDSPFCGSQPTHSSSSSRSPHHHSSQQQHHRNYNHHNHHHHHPQPGAGSPSSSSSPSEVSSSSSSSPSSSFISSSSSHSASALASSALTASDSIIQASIVLRREEIPSYVNGYPVTGHSIFPDAKLVDKIVDLYFTTNHPDQSAFQLYWTQLSILPETVDSTEALVQLSHECDFLCKTSRACLRANLVCNGFPNCPLTMANDDQTSSPSTASINSDLSHSYSNSILLTSEDEDETICHRPSILLSFISNRFVLLTVSLVILLSLIGTSLHVARKFRLKYRQKKQHF